MKWKDPLQLSTALITLLFLLAPRFASADPLYVDRLVLDTHALTASVSAHVDRAGVPGPVGRPGEPVLSHATVSTSNGLRIWTAELPLVCVTRGGEAATLQAINAQIKSFSGRLRDTGPYESPPYIDVYVYVKDCAGSTTNDGWVFTYRESRPPEGVFSCTLEIPAEVDLGVLAADTERDVGAAVRCVEKGEGTVTLSLASPATTTPTRGLKISTTVQKGLIAVRGGTSTPVEIKVNAAVADPTAGQFSASFVYVLTLH